VPHWITGRAAGVVERAGGDSRRWFAFLTHLPHVRLAGAAIAEPDSVAERQRLYSDVFGAATAPCVEESTRSAREGAPAVVRPGRTRPGQVSDAPFWFPDWTPSLNGESASDGRHLPGSKPRSFSWRSPGAFGAFGHLGEQGNRLPADRRRPVAMASRWASRMHRRRERLRSGEKIAGLAKNMIYS